ncbi:MAG: TatD family hydrolase [Anaerolineales bacterium]
MQFFDTHSHLDFNAFDDDRPQVLARAADAGLMGILVPMVELGDAARLFSLVNAAAPVFAAVGVHPNSALTWDESSLAHLRELAAHPKTLAIGEIGLDYYWQDAPHDVQQRVLRAQLALAAECNLPVIIHNREATADVLTMLTEWQRSLAAQNHPLAARPGVLHSFSANWEAAQTALAHNFYIGITGPVTFKKAANLHEVARQTPLERLLIETDAPFLSPHPFRGQRNEPARVTLVAEKIAQLKQIPIAQVAQQTTQNALNLFQPEPSFEPRSSL